MAIQYQPKVLTEVPILGSAAVHSDWGKIKRLYKELSTWKNSKTQEATSAAAELGEYSDKTLWTQDKKPERNLSAVWPSWDLFGVLEVL